MSVRSMTGFARVRRAGDSGEAVATVKSVNHRALDLHLHLPSDLETLEPKVRDLARRFVTRGHVDIRLSFIPSHSTGTHALNRPLFEAWLASFRTIGQEYGFSAEPDVNQALRVPSMLSQPRDEDAPAEVETLVLGVLEEAFQAFNRFRTREGDHLAALIRESLAGVRKAASGIADLREQVLPALHKRLEQRLDELLAKTAAAPERLAQEAALLADRSDIAEEVGRLRVHAEELGEMVEKGGEIGKKLDFLLQEMNRETNTILSKTSGVGDLGLTITALGLEAKSNIERIREQALNIE